MTRAAQDTRFLENFHLLPDLDQTQGFLTVRRAGLVEAGSGYAIRRPSLLGHDLLYCQAGAGSVHLAQSPYSVRAGQMAWLPGHLSHSHQADPADPWTLLWVRLDGPAMTTCWQRLMERRGPVIDIQSGAALLAWFQKLFACLRLKAINNDLVLNALAAELLVLIEADLRGGLSAELPPPLSRLLSAMAANPSQAWTESEMEACAAISAAHLRRLFRTHLKTTPRGWLRRERILLAQDLLSRPGARVGSVAEACGFCDIYHFSRDFRRVVGQSPNQWRQGEAGPTRP